MNYFYKQGNGWIDTLSSELNPRILERRGWLQCSKEHYEAYREKNALKNSDK